MNKLYSIFLLFLLIYTQGFGETFERLYERILREYALEEEDNTDLYYLLETYYQTPLDLNRAKTRSLEKLSFLFPFLSKQDVKAIVKKRKEKPFVTSLELVSMALVSKEDFEIIKYFINVKPSRKKKTFEIILINNIVFKHTNGGADGISFLEGRNLHLLAGDQEYGHNPFRVEHKFSFEIPGQIEVHFTLQQDAYEESYVDLIKGALLLEFAFSLEQIALGALSVAWGQSVMFSTSTGGAYPHAGRVIQYRKSSRMDISRGTSENYLLGMGISWTLERFFIQAFSGTFNYDGDLISSDFQGQVEHFRTIKTDEIHDSTNALRQKNRQWEFLTGVNVDYRWNPGSYIGLGFLYSEFLYPIKPEVNDTLDNYKFYGKRYGGMSLHWSISERQGVIFGEVMGYLIPDLENPSEYAFEENLPYTFEPGIVVGLVYGKRTMRTQISFRYYSPFLLDFHSRGFSKSGSQGEIGFYTAAEWKLYRQLTWRLFIDAADSLYPNLSRDIETKLGSGIDWRIYKKTKLRVTGSLGFETEDLDTSNVGPGTDADLTTEISYRHPYFFVRCRGSFSGEYFDNRANSHGVAGILEIDIFPLPWLTLTTRSLIHDTELNIYTGNENIPGLFTGSRILSGSGWGIDFVSYVTVIDMFELGIKYGYAQSRKEEGEEIIETISEEIQAQFRFKY